MNSTSASRRNFIKKTAATSLALSVSSSAFPWSFTKEQNGKRIGIIGLDTSHSTAFTKVLNDQNPDPVFDGFKVVAAYPHGSKDIESSVKRIPGYIEEVK